MNLHPGPKFPQTSQPTTGSNWNDGFQLPLPFYPDETLYNICGRTRQLRGRTSKDVRTEMFGVKTMHDIVDLPARLGYLEANPEVGAILNADQIINEHSSVPFFAPFIGQQQLMRLIQAVTETTPVLSLRMMSARFQGPSLRPGSLRYCWRCVQEDRAEYREAYWHRVHQIGCVHVCPEHAVFLSSSSLRRRSAQTRYLTAEEIIGEPRPSPVIDVSRGFDRAQLWIAEQVQWLLRNPGFAFDQNQISEVYLYHLSLAGLVTSTGQIRMAELASRLVDFYGPLLKIVRAGAKIGHSTPRERGIAAE